MRIGFIGGGNMATALISSLFASRHNVDRVQVADPGADARGYLQKRWPVTCYEHAAEAIKGMDAQTIDHSIILVFILIGNIAFFGTRGRKG